MAGLLDLLGAHARRSWIRAGLVALLFPVATVYVLGTLVVPMVRHALSRSPGSGHGTPAGRHPNLRRRYRGSQRLIDALERRLVGTLLLRLGEPARILDVPVGYGRFLAPLRAMATRAIVVGDISAKRLTTLAAKDGGGRGPLVRVGVDLEQGLPFASGVFDAVFNVRYLHHIGDPGRRGAVLAELMRVSRRYVVVSYYRGSNLHARVREWHTATRGDRRPPPAMMGRGELEAACRPVGWRVASDRGVLPWFHAQRVALLQRTDV